MKTVMREDSERLVQHMQKTEEQNAQLLDFMRQYVQAKLRDATE